MFLTPDEIAEALKVPVATVQTWLDGGDLPAFQLGDQWRVRQEDFDAFVQDRVDETRNRTMGRALTDVNTWVAAMPNDPEFLAKLQDAPRDSMGAWLREGLERRKAIRRGGQRGRVLTAPEVRRPRGRQLASVKTTSKGKI
jgi:excisionase family DNA binding protein